MVRKHLSKVQTDKIIEAACPKYKRGYRFHKWIKSINVYCLCLHNIKIVYFSPSTVLALSYSKPQLLPVLHPLANIPNLLALLLSLDSIHRHSRSALWEGTVDSSASCLSSLAHPPPVPFANSLCVRDSQQKAKFSWHSFSRDLLPYLLASFNSVGWGVLLKIGILISIRSDLN